MKVLNIGSMNLDLVYSVDHIVQPGETEASTALDTFLGVILGISTAQYRAQNEEEEE